MVSKLTDANGVEVLIPGNTEAVELIKQMKHGQSYAADITMLRNPELHKKAFKFLKVCFEYWEPQSIDDIEKKLFTWQRKWFACNGNTDETAKALITTMVEDLKQERSGNPACKEFDIFRELMTIRAGFYTEVGPKKYAKSWSYVNMSEDEFQRLFEKIKLATWEELINNGHNVFDSIQDIENAAAQLQDFD